MYIDREPSRSTSTSHVSRYDQFCSVHFSVCHQKTNISPGRVNGTSCMVICRTNLCVLAAFLEQKIDHLTLWFDWIVQRDWWGNVHIIEHIFQKQATLNDLSYNRKAKKNQSCVKHWPFASATNKVVFYRLF